MITAGSPTQKRKAMSQLVDVRSYLKPPRIGRTRKLYSLRFLVCVCKAGHGIEG